MKIKLFAFEKLVGSLRTRHLGDRAILPSQKTPFISLLGPKCHAQHFFNIYAALLNCV